MALIGKAALCAIAATILSGCATSPHSGGKVIRIDASEVIASGVDSKVGINLNYLTDGDRPLDQTVAAIAELGVSYLRFPGGEKADNYLWSVDPWDAPNPHFARTGSNDWPSSDPRFASPDRSRPRGTTLAFDDFIRIARRTGAEPVVVVALDSMYKPPAPDGTAPSRELLVRTATEWVRYANVRRGYGVRYWEIGNESYHEGSYNGIAPSVEAYVRDLETFAAAMKAVDPTILIGANGNQEWFESAAMRRSEATDFFSVHTYPTWDILSYETYVGYRGDFADAARLALVSAGRTPMEPARVAVTEFNAIYWGDQSGWPNRNDLGHALAVAGIIGDHLSVGNLEMLVYWNTRWVDRDESVYDAIRADGSLTPTGEAIALWNRAALGEMVAIGRDRSGPDAYATRTRDGDQINVILINRRGDAVDTTLRVSGASVRGVRRVYDLTGRADDTTDLVLRDRTAPTVAGNGLSVRLSAYSVTVVEIVAEPAIPGE